MANTTLTSASQVQKWEAQFFAEYIRDSGFQPYVSRGSDAVITAKYQLTEGGRTINLPLVTRLTGAGVTGGATLEGNEEALGNYNQSIRIDWKRHGVRIGKDQAHDTEMDLRRAARDTLNGWAKNELRKDFITAFASIHVSGTDAGVAYGSATEAQKDAWIDNNTDRVLFGSAKSNLSTLAPAGGATYDHSGSLANVDASNDKLTAASVSLMKRMARTADPHIRPMRVRNSQGREFFVLFAGSEPFRDLKGDSTIAQANREARPRDVDNNPIFQDGDLIYDGVIIREIPEILPLSGVGASSIDVGQVFMCGAQALGIAWGQETRSKTEAFDYGFYRGVAVEEARGIEKLVFNDVDHGIVTGHFAAVADA